MKRMDKGKETWLNNLWRASRRNSMSGSDKTCVGIMSFEVASAMSKVVNLWKCLSDQTMSRLREEITNSLGIQKLVSRDDDYLMGLAFTELFENVRFVAQSVARFGKRCLDPLYHSLELVFDDIFEIDQSWCGWDYRLKKMEKKVKKMERFAAVTSQLYQELEVLAELERSFWKIKLNGSSSQSKLHEFHKKVAWQRQEVKNLREMSPWIRTYDYVVRILLRSLFTIVRRVEHVYGINRMEFTEESLDPELGSNGCLVRSNSISSLTRSAVHPSEKYLSRLYAGSVGRSVSSLGVGRSKMKLQNKKLRSKSRRLANIEPFIGCMSAGNTSPVCGSSSIQNSGSLMSSGVFLTGNHELQSTCTGYVGQDNVSRFGLKCKLPSAPASTLGYAALALHYANIIILIEKLALSPHLISQDARQDIYNMLTSTIKNSVTAKLKLSSKTLESSVYDRAIAMNWSLTLGSILEWLAPLAHNTIRWHSEHNFEKQRMPSGTNFLLVQTLYFANQAKTEVAITELLMGLHYISRFGREVIEKAFS